jgi:hypothetical protein
VFPFLSGLDLGFSRRLASERLRTSLASLGIEGHDVARARGAARLKLPGELRDRRPFLRLARPLDGLRERHLDGIRRLANTRWPMPLTRSGSYGNGRLRGRAFNSLRRGKRRFHA